MAKLGEGEKRWIVEEREDGTNVQGWHWVEKDCLEWSKQFYQRELSMLTTAKKKKKENEEGDDEDEDDAIEFKQVKIKGEAYLNQRKGKIIAGYEIECECEFVFNSSKECLMGKMVLPYVSDENHGDDTEVKFSFSSEEASGAKKYCETIVKPKVREIVKKWEKEMASGIPTQQQPKGAAAAISAKSTETTKTETETATKKIREQKQHEYKKAPLSKTKHTIRLKETFICRATDVCEALLDPQRVAHFTRTKCTGQKGLGKFSLFDGGVDGETIAFEDGKSITQKWRFKSWGDNFSTVKMTFSEPEPGNTILLLEQTDVPESDEYGNENVMEVTENGWKNLIFSRIRNAFGYGASL